MLMMIVLLSVVSVIVWAYRISYGCSEESCITENCRVEKDEEMVQLMEEDKSNCKVEIQQLENQIVVLMVPVDEADVKNAIVELRPGTKFGRNLVECAGTGGQEAALFAGDVFRMYEKYALAKVILLPTP